jgi:membrane protease YdiL (CAAX protease family)
MNRTHATYLSLIEPLALAAFVALFIWRLQDMQPYSWIAFPAWFLLSFLVHRDTPKTLGWRTDNFWPATRGAAAVFAVFALGICGAGLFLGAVHRLPEHLIEPRRFAGYLAFCLLQQVALNSYLTNRLAAALDPVPGAIVSGAIFGALHWPNPILVPLTFIGGTAMAWLFQRERNILPLALGQAVMGALIWWAFPIPWHHSMRVGPGYYTFHH